MSGPDRPAPRRIESWGDRMIREAHERGAFDTTFGKGEPIADLDTDDELWWVKRWLRRENLEVPLPPALAMRREVDELQDTLASAPDEANVRAVVDELNDRIRHLNRYPTDGPPSSVSVLDADLVVERWAARRAGS